MTFISASRRLTFEPQTSDGNLTSGALGPAEVPSTSQRSATVKGSCFGSRGYGRRSYRKSGGGEKEVQRSPGFEDFEIVRVVGAVASDIPQLGARCLVSLFFSSFLRNVLGILRNGDRFPRDKQGSNEEISK